MSIDPNRGSLSDVIPTLPLCSRSRSYSFVALAALTTLAGSVGLGTSVRTSAAAVAATTVAETSAPRLVGVRASGHRSFDRVIFRFDGGLPRQVSVRYVPALIQDASGRRIPMPGRAILRVMLSPAVAHDERGRPTAPASLSLPLRNVMRISRAGDFEAVVSYGIGLAQRRSFHVSRLHDPSRVVLTVNNRYRAVQKRVWFMNEPAFAKGRQPYVSPVSRWVPASTPATGLLDRLFAGPSAAEEAKGLRLVRSKVTGFRDLSISNGIAHVRLVGGCSSGGSTFTIADEMLPTLTQLPTISAVKIYDPSGKTLNPHGSSSSLPECLQP